MKPYESMKGNSGIHRRRFLQTSGAVGAGLVLGVPSGCSKQPTEQERPGKPKTNVDDALAIPRTAHSLPGAHPGRVIEVHDPKSLVEDRPVGDVVASMFERGVTRLMEKDLAGSFAALFTPQDVVGIKVNPVGAGLISTRLEVVDAVIDWLTASGVPRGNIVIWDRFDAMLGEAGFTPERYPGVRIEGLQTMDESAASGESDDDSRWLDPNGNHVSLANFDLEFPYWVDVDGPEDKAYLNQHVLNGKESPFGKLLTQELTRIINIPVFKNTGNGISMATKNLGYGAICNTGRLHKPLFFDVCTEVLAFPAIRDKLVLNVTDGLCGQYDGGPMPNAEFAYPYQRLFLATDPFALDMICHRLMVAKRKNMGIEVNENPMFTDYLYYAERLGLGIADPERIEHVLV
jgi:hypothetical protein